MEDAWSSLNLHSNYAPFALKVWKIEALSNKAGNVYLQFFFKETLTKHMS